MNLDPPKFQWPSHRPRRCAALAAAKVLRERIVSMAFSSAKALRLLGIFANEIVWFLRDFVQTPQRDVQHNSVAKA